LALSEQASASLSRGKHVKAGALLLLWRLHRHQWRPAARVSANERVLSADFIKIKPAAAKTSSRSS